MDMQKQARVLARANNPKFVQSEQYSPDSGGASYGRVLSMRVIICGLCGSLRSTQASTQMFAVH